jgi:Amt family ammonium transporter
MQFLVFIFLWTTVVYDPIARWTWDSQGWSRTKLNTLDFAGGTVVHISSGAAVTAIGCYYGLKRWWVEHKVRNDPQALSAEIENRTAHVSRLEANDVTSVCLGTMLLWFGWFGFNGGSELAANPRSASAFMNTQTAPCFGGVTSLVIHWGLNWYQKKWGEEEDESEKSDSALAFCNGVVVALVAITPAAGYVR